MKLNKLIMQHQKDYKKHMIVKINMKQIMNGNLLIGQILKHQMNIHVLDILELIEN